MQAAYSAIFFTAAAGAGYGLIGLMALFQAAGVLPTDRGLGMAGFGLAFALITAALAGPAVHPGHPRRRWRTIGAWTATPPGREGLFALLTYLPAGAYAAGWCFIDWRTEFFTLIGMIAAMLCMQTVYSTAMIYTSQKTVRAWTNGWVPLAYFSLSIMTGALLLQALATAFGYFHPAYFWVGSLAVAAAGIVKMQYWRFVDRATGTAAGTAPGTAAGTAPGTATGTAAAETTAGAAEDADSIDTPASGARPLLTESLYRTAREQSPRLRQIAVAAAFVAPLLLVTLANISPPQSAVALTLLAAVIAVPGVLIERWLFFAEATQVELPDDDAPPA